MPDKILVTGATGKLGLEVVRRLLDAGVEVKAGTRSPERCARIFADDVEVVHLDYDVTESWDAAVQWADRVFLVPPPFDPDSDERLVPFLDWAVQSGTRHIVLVSAMGAETRDRLSLHGIERRLTGTGVAWTILRPNIYMQNFARGFIARSIRTSGTFRVAAGTGRVSFIDARDVAEIAARALTSGEHFDHACTLTGPAALTHEEAARVIALAAGRPVAYEPVDEDAMHEQLRDLSWDRGQTATFLSLLASIRAGERETVTGDAARLLGRQPTSFEAFARDHAARWR
ncbi:MAG TPA: SDR family oxidoreductase [Longimicrobiales bacterium]